MSNDIFLLTLVNYTKHFFKFFIQYGLNTSLHLKIKPYNRTFGDQSRIRCTIRRKVRTIMIQRHNDMQIFLQSCTESIIQSIPDKFIFEVILRGKKLINFFCSIQTWNFSRTYKTIDNFKEFWVDQLVIFDEKNCGFILSDHDFEIRFNVFFEVS